MEYTIISAKPNQRYEINLDNLNSIEDIKEILKFIKLSFGFHGNNDEWDERMKELIEMKLLIPVK
jgi:hypothetical protein